MEDDSVAILKLDRGLVCCWTSYLYALQTIYQYCLCVELPLTPLFAPSLKELGFCPLNHHFTSPFLTNTPLAETVDVAPVRTSKMPTFENIVLTLQSQYDALRIPERLSASSDRSSPSSHHHGCIIEVDIPSYTGSQFWISYDCASSTTEGDDDDRDGSGGGRFDPKVRFYFFRLHVLDGACLLNWGVGEHDDWRGKTMFGLYDGGSDFEGKKVVEKRGMFFPSRREPRRDAGFEVQVFRSRARVKQKTAFAKSRSVGSGDALG